MKPKLLNPPNVWWTLRIQNLISIRNFNTFKKYDHQGLIDWIDWRINDLKTHALIGKPPIYSRPEGETE